LGCRLRRISANAFGKIGDIAAHQSLDVPFSSLRGWLFALLWLGGVFVIIHSGLGEIESAVVGLPQSGGPVSVLVHDGSWRYGWDGRRSCAGWRSRPLRDLGGWRAVAQR